MLLYSIQFLHQITTATVRVRIEVELYSIQFLHQITTAKGIAIDLLLLYSIQFLHQITTSLVMRKFSVGCIVFNFYIKSQLIGQGSLKWLSCIVFNFYIKSQLAQRADCCERVV